MPLLVLAKQLSPSFRQQASDKTHKAYIKIWGSPETLITRSDGVLVRIKGKHILKDTETEAFTAGLAAAIQQWDRT